MAVSLKDIYGVLDQADKHHRALLALHTELRSMIAALPIPAEPSQYSCKCGFSFRSERALAFHLQNVHDGPPVPLTETELRA